jgi:hypothetical protein
MLTKLACFAFKKDELFFISKGGLNSKNNYNAFLKFEKINKFFNKNFQYL